MLTRLKQVAIAVETTENTAVSDASLYVAGNCAYSVMNPEASFDLQLTEREINRDTLTPLRPLTGRKFGMVKFGLELAGNTGTGAPEVDIPLRACGFRRATLRRYTIGAITGGPFKHGEVISHTAGAVTARVVGDTYTGQPYLYVTQADGAGTGTLLAAPTTLTGATSGATVSGTAISSGTGGYGYWPSSYSVTQIDLSVATSNAITDGDLLTGATSGAVMYAFGTFSSGVTTIYVRRHYGHYSSAEQVNNTTAGNIAIAASSTIVESQLHIPSLSIGGLFDGVREAIFGARGTVQFSVNVGEPMKLAFEFKGAKKSFQDGGLISGVSLTQRLPDVWLDGDTQVALDATTSYSTEVSACMAQAQFDMGNDVQFKLCSDDATGQHETYIGARKGTFQIDPEQMPETFFPWLATFTGNSNFRFRTRLGSAFASTDKFWEVRMPGGAITSITPGDRNGIQTRQISGTMSSGAQTASTVNRENELVLIYNNGAT